MPGTFSPPPTSKETAICNHIISFGLESRKTTSQQSRHASQQVHHARAVMHVGLANPRWQGKCSRPGACTTHNFTYLVRDPIKHRNRIYTWSETYFRQDLFPSYLFFGRQFHAIVIFRLKSISDLDSGCLPRFFGEFIFAKLTIVKWPKLRSPMDRVRVRARVRLELVSNSVSS